MKNIKKLFLVLLTVMQIFAVQAFEMSQSLSEKYTVDENVAQIKDIADVPALQHLCKKFVRKDWSEKVDKAFALADTKDLTEVDHEQLQAVIQYNKHLQHDPDVTAYIQLPALFDIKNENHKKLSDCLIEQENWQTIQVALEHGLNKDIYKQDALEKLHRHVDQTFKFAGKQDWTDTDTEKFQDILIASESLRHNTLSIADIALPSIFHFQDTNGNKIINYVMGENNSVALRLMLDHGLDLYSCYHGQNSLLDLAVCGNAEDCVQLILSYKKQGNNIFEQQAIDEQDRRDKLQLLHMLNAKDGTPLICAAGNRSPKIVQQLLTAGADVNQINHNGCRALQWAVMRDAVEIIPLLLNAGADVHQTNHCELTALHCAALGNNFEAVQLLIAAGSHINQVDKLGKTPLFYAEQVQAHEAIALLHSVGAWVTESMNIAEVKPGNVNEIDHVQIDNSINNIETIIPQVRHSSCCLIS